MNDAINYSVLSVHTSKGSGCLDNVENDTSKGEDYCDEYHQQCYLEMFRHALKESDQRAQRKFEQHFGITLLDWIHYHPRTDLACRLHTEEDYIVESFRRFWQTSLQHQKFDLLSMTDILTDLRVSLNGVLIDAFRCYSRSQEAPLICSDQVRDMLSNESENSNGIVRFIEKKLSNVRERRLAYLLFHYALTPEEIVGHFPHEFSDVCEISHLRRNIMKLLSSDDQFCFVTEKIS